MSVFKPKIQFLVITGAMRSGTTLLGELIYSRDQKARHPACSFANDNIDTLRDILKKIEKPNLGDHFDDEAALVEVLRSHYNFPQNWNAYLVIERARELLINEIQEACPSESEVQVIGLKLTNLMPYYNFIKIIFENVIIVTMIRDPRDVYASNYVRNKLNESVASLIFTDLLDTYSFLMGNKDDCNVIAIKYEDLVSNPMVIVNNLLNKLNLDASQYSWECLDNVASNSSHNEGRGVDLVKCIGISKSSLGVFNTILKEEDILFIEWLLEDYINKFSYDSSDIPCAKRIDFVKDLENKIINIIYAHIENGVGCNTLIAQVNLKGRKYGRIMQGRFGDFFHLCANLKYNQTKLSMICDRNRFLENELIDLRRMYSELECKVKYTT